MAKKFPWYKRYASDALTGKLGLDPAQKGVYDTLIDLCYDRNSAIVDDDVELARLCGCSRRLYRALRDQLIEKGKVWREPDGRLMVKGFRRGSDTFRGDFEENSTPENRLKIGRKSDESRPKSTAPDGKTNAYGGITPSRARAQGQSPESRVQNPPVARFKNLVDLGDLTRRLCAELGEPWDPKGERGNWPSLLGKMLEENELDFENDLLPAVRARMSRPISVRIRTPLFFRQEAIAIAQDRNRTAFTTPTVQDAEDVTTPRKWQKAITRFLECGIWIGPGPSPLSPACKAPDDLLDVCRMAWTTQGNHPVYADADGNFPWKPKEGSRGMGSDIFPEAKPVETIPGKGAQH